MRVELGQVDQVDADQLAHLDLDGVPGVVERDRVDRVDLVLVVEVGVEAVHHHHHLAAPAAGPAGGSMMNAPYSPLWMWRLSGMTWQ